MNIGKVKRGNRGADMIELNNITTITRGSNRIVPIIIKIVNQVYVLCFLLVTNEKKTELANKTFSRNSFRIANISPTISARVASPMIDHESVEGMMKLKRATTDSSRWAKAAFCHIC